MPAVPCKPSSISEVITSIGFGPAQVSTLIFGPGIWAVDCIEAVLVTTLAKPMAHELHMSDLGTATLVAVSLAGMLVGSSIGGALGDYAGRRPTILLSYVCVTIFPLLIALTSVSIPIFVILRTLLGISMGIGMPPSLALISEISPPSYRDLLSGMRSVIIGLGGVTAGAIIVSDEPTLQRLSWRFDLALSATPSLILTLLALFYLQESPLFLAQVGQHDRAKEVLKWMSHRNNTPEIDLDYEHAGMEAAHVSATSITCFGAVQIICSRHLVYTTCTLGVSAFVLSQIEYGLAYAMPRVLQQTHATLPAGWQVLLVQLVGIPLRFCAIPVGALLSRRASLQVITIGNATCAFLFSWTGGMLHRSLPLALVYYASQYGMVFLGVLGFIVVYQASVDVYPTLVSATGSAACVGFGRLGGLLAPYLFELFTNEGVWQHFLWYLAASSLLAAVLCAFLPDAVQASQAVEAALDEFQASKPLAQT